MGFIDSKVLWSIKYPISVDATASDHPECSQSFGREQNSPSGGPLAGTSLLIYIYIYLSLYRDSILKVCANTNRHTHTHNTPTETNCGISNFSLHLLHSNFKLLNQTIFPLIHCFEKGLCADGIDVLVRIGILGSLGFASDVFSGIGMFGL